MSDLIDDANDKIEKEADYKVDFIRRVAASIPEGYPGECYQCGEHNARLVKGMCSPCRDLHGE